MADTPIRTPNDAVPAADGPAQPPRRSISMHDGVPVWHDCCSCEAEPYWATLAEETGSATEAGPDDTEAS